jgi:Spy/CpxP family protein refolding chaperone
MNIIKNVKWLGAIVLSASIGYGSVAFAQDGAKDPAKQEQRREHMQKRAEHMKKALGITDAQGQQIKAIREQNKAKLQADRLAIKNAPDKAARKAAVEQFKNDRKAERDQIKALLNADQKAKLEQMKERRKANMEKRHAAHGKKG